MHGHGTGNDIVPTPDSVKDEMILVSNKLKDALSGLHSQLEAEKQKIVDLDSQRQQLQETKSTDSTPNKVRVPSVRTHDSVAAAKPRDTVVAPPSIQIHIGADTKPAAAGAVPVSSSKSTGGTTLFVSTHRILSLSEEDFLRTPVSEMMSWYGETNGVGSCNNDFGNSLVNRWRDTKQSYCTPTQGRSVESKSKSAPVGPSSIGDTFSNIDCYLVRQTRHAGGGDNICVMKDVSVNMGYYGNDQAMGDVVQKYVGSRHRYQPYVPFPKGFINTNECRLEPSKWIEKSMPGWNADWTTKAVNSIVDDPQNEGLECSEWVEHPVLVVQRDTFANFFHDSEDFINAFLTLAVLEWNVGETQIYLGDLFPEGPFWDIWGTIFGRGYRADNKVHYHETVTKRTKIGKPPMTSWDLRSHFGRTERGTSNVKNRVCYKQLAINIYGPAAPICVISWNTPCKKTALIRAYSDFIIRGMNLQGLTHYAQPTSEKTITVTYMARRASALWPEKKYCSDNSSFFKCKLWKDWGIRSHGRMVRNDQEIMEALRKEFTKEKYQYEFKFEDVDYNLLSFEDQIKTNLRTDIMVSSFPEEYSYKHVCYRYNISRILFFCAANNCRLVHTVLA